jgi:hypothetical protein
MKIVNETRYDTKTLRKIGALCLAEFARRERTNKKRARSYKIVFKTHKGQGWVGGYAYYNSKWLTVKLPLKYDRTRFTFVQSVADVIFHEIGHCLGIRHRLNRGRKHDTIESEYEDWIRETFDSSWELPLEEKKKKEKQDVQLVRFAKAKTNAERAMSRYKRAKNLLDKWNSKVKYYEKALVRAGKMPEKEE